MRASDADAAAATIDDEVIEAQGYTDAAPAYFHERACGLGSEESLSGCAVWFAVCDHAGNVVGDYELTRVGSREPWTLGWWLGPGARGHGLGRESLAAVLAYAHRHVGIADVRMGTKATNERALRQIRGTGAQEIERTAHKLPNRTRVSGVWFLHSDPGMNADARSPTWRPPCHAWADLDASTPNEATGS